MLNRRWPFSGRWVCAPEPHWITNPRRRVCSTPSTSGAPAPERSRPELLLASPIRGQRTHRDHAVRVSQPRPRLLLYLNLSSPAQPGQTGPGPIRHRAARPGHRAAPGHRRPRAPVRRGHRDLGRHRYLGLACQIHLRLLATDHRDPAGGHRRQPGNRRGPGLDPAAPHSAVPGLRQRLLRSHRCVQPITRGRARDPAPAAQPHLHVRARGAANLRFGSRPRPGRHRRTSVARHPLPDRRHRWRAHGHPGRRLDSRPLLPANARRPRGLKCPGVIFSDRR